MSPRPPPATDRRVAERGAVDPETFAREVLPAYRPVILRGQVRDWPAVAKAAEGERALATYLAGFGGGQPLEVLVGAPAIDGHFFYTPDLTGFNFRRQQVPLGSLLGELVRLAEADERAPPALYANAAAAPGHLPGWAETHRLDIADAGAVPRFWIGNASRTATHYDVTTNVACVVAGRRRFTLFPPEQVGNLYLGPFDRTLAGPAVSMVDPDAPDHARYPRYAEALAHAEVAELEPGDAIFVPAAWWHHVRAFDRLNVLVNYWWPYDAWASPFLSLAHALMSVRDLPPAQKRAWKAWFDHYVFADDADAAGAHLPEQARGVLGEAGAERNERIRAFLLGSLAPRG